MRDIQVRNQCHPEILRFYCRHAGQAVDWLDSLGAYTSETRQPVPVQYGEDWTVHRTYRVDGPLLNVISAEYRKRLERGDIELRLNTTVINLVEEQGRVVGIMAKGEGKVENMYRTGAVIVCTGGFGSNIAFVRRYNLPGAKLVMTAAPAFAKGDGLTLCEKVGAKTVNLSRPAKSGIYLGCVPDPKRPERQIAHVNVKKYPGAIWVDTQGRRVVNEDCGAYAPEARVAMENAPGQVLIVVLDRKIKEENQPILIKWFGVPERSWDWFEKKANEGVIIKKADTIEELGHKLDINVQNLRDTIARWNGFVESGKDLDFGRQDVAYKIESPPFYAIPTGTLVLGSHGGPAVNVRQQVLDEQEKVIAGLYAVGEITGYRGHGTGGLNTGNIVFGRQAAIMAAWHVLHRH